MQEISSCRIVQYTLTDGDVYEIERRREADAHARGSAAYVGDMLPMLVVAVVGDQFVNGQVFLDGNDTLWKSSVPLSNVDDGQKLPVQPGCWSWPSRVEEVEPPEAPTADEAPPDKREENE